MCFSSSINYLSYGDCVYESLVRIITVNYDMKNQCESYESEDITSSGTDIQFNGQIRRREQLIPLFASIPEEKKKKRKKKRILPFHNFHRHVQPTDLKRAGAARLVVSHNTYMESFNDACLIATHRGREGDWLLEESALLEQSFERARGNECNRSCHSIWPKAARRRNGNVKIALKISSWRGFAPSTRLQKPRSCVTSAAGVMNAEPRH